MHTYSTITPGTHVGFRRFTRVWPFLFSVLSISNPPHHTKAVPQAVSPREQSETNNFS